MIVVDTKPATNLTAHGALLKGDLVDMGGQPSVSVHFDYGVVSGAYTEGTTPVVVLLVGAFSVTVAHLKSETMYYFRAVADGVFGVEESFTTLKPIEVPSSSLPMIGSISVPLVRQPNVM